MIHYQGKHPFFDFSKIQTCPIAGRPNREKFADLITPDEALARTWDFKHPDLETVAEVLIEMRDAGRPIIWQMGAHPVKGHLSLLLIDLMRRGFISLLAGNGAVAIHDFEWALIGETSETVPNALPTGQFGMAYESGTYMNDAMAHGNKLKLGLGECLARMILGEPMPYTVKFKHPEISVMAQSGHRSTASMRKYVRHGSLFVNNAAAAVGL